MSSLQVQELQRELSTAQRQGETSKVRAKTQMSALELRCGALESESEGLNGAREGGRLAWPGHSGQDRALESQGEKHHCEIVQHTLWQHCTIQT